VTSILAASPPNPDSPADSWWGRRFGGLPRAFWALFGGIAAARLGFFVVPFLSFWLVADRGLAPGDVGLVMTAFGVGWALSTPLGGWLADRLGRRAVIVASGAGAAGAYLGIAAVHAVAWLVVAALFVGATFDLYRPALQAAITDAVPAAARTRALGLLYLAMNASRMIACAAGGAVANTGEFAILFVANAVVNIAFGAVIWRAVPADRPTRAQGGSGGLRMALADQRLVVFTLATFAFYTIHTQSMVALPVVFAHAGATPLIYGVLLALDPLVVVVCQVGAQAVLNRIPALVTCAAGVTAVGVGLALSGLSPNLAWMTCTLPIWVIGEMAFLTAAPGVVAALAPDRSRGTYFGIWGATQGAAAVLAPLLAATASATGRTDLIWSGGALAGLLTTATLLAMYSRERQQAGGRPLGPATTTSAVTRQRSEPPADVEGHIGRSTSTTGAPRRKERSRH